VGSEMEFGCLQGCTIDFSFDKATLFCGGSLYPRDVRIHTSNITGKAQFAEVDGEAFYFLLGGDGYVTGDTQVVLKANTRPAAFRVRLVNVTDGITMTVTLVRCRTDSLSFGMERTNYIIPDFGFTAYQDDTETVATIDLGDAS
jgi:hypothetical protein